MRPYAGPMGSEDERQQDVDALVSRAIEDLQRTSDSVAGALAASEDLDRAFAAASRWTDTLRTQTNAAGESRAQLAVKIHEKEGLSLSALAKRWGVSKARAAQLVRTKAVDERR